MATETKIDLLTPAEDAGMQFATGNNDFGSFISLVLQALMVIGLISVFIFLIWGALEWITAGGEKSKTEGARNKITGAVIGLLVLASTVAIFALIQSYFGFEIFKFASSRSGSGSSLQQQGGPSGSTTSPFRDVSRPANR